MKRSNPLSIIQRAEIQGWIFILFGFIGFVAWAATYQIDQGIAGYGYLISKVERIQIIAPSTGLVSDINFRAGDSVLKGDVLLKLDSKSLQANERSIQESIRGIEASNVSLQIALTKKNSHIAALQTQLDSYLSLVDAGFYKNANAFTTIQTELFHSESQAFELRSRIEQGIFQLRELSERAASLRHEIDLLNINAPVSGKIMNIAVNSVGVTITAGSQIMEIVPDGEQLLIDVRIPVDYSTRAHTGMAVDVMFPTLPGSSTIRIKGRLDYLSADRITDSRTNQIYLEGRVSLDDQSQINLNNLRAGLPATVLLNTGPRTLLSYITRPFSERLARGLQ